MMELFGEKMSLLKGILIMNYNPTVEAKRSSEFLLYGLYRMFNKVKNYE